MIVRRRKKQIAVFLIILSFTLVPLLVDLWKENRIIFIKKFNNNSRYNLHTSSNYNLEWVKTWGGEDYDKGQGICIDDLGNIYLLSHSELTEAGNFDICLLYYDISSNELELVQTWESLSNDYAEGMIIDKSGNIYITGSTYDNNTMCYDILFLKYDKSRVLQWNKTWKGYSDDFGNGIVVDSLGNIYIIGYTKSVGENWIDICLLKYNSLGFLEWNKTWGAISADYGMEICIDNFDNLYITGAKYDYENRNYEVCLVKFNSSGFEQWNKTWGGLNNDYGIGMTRDNLGNIYITGSTWSFGNGKSDIFLLKYDSFGSLKWNKTWGGEYSDYGFGIAISESGNIFVTGYTSSIEKGTDICLLKYFNDGKIIWSKIWGGSNDEEGYKLVLDDLENIYIVGTTWSYGNGYSDVCLLKFRETQSIFIYGYNLGFLSLIIGISLIFLFLKKKEEFIK